MVHSSKWYHDLAAVLGHPGFVTLLEVTAQEFRDNHPGHAATWAIEIEQEAVN
jgi:hypothetical protein